MAGCTKYRVKNWSKFQHYKNRNPPWIRLHVEILDDYKADGTENDFHALPDKNKLTLLLIWALASRYNGVIPSIDPAWLAVKLGIDDPSTDALIQTGFLIPVSDASADASNTLAPLHGDCVPETETETETESETDAEGECREPPTQAQPEPNNAMRPKPPRKPKSAADDLDRLRPVYAAIGVDVDRELVKCRAWCQAHGHGEPTVRRLVNWLNRADKSIGGATPASSVHRGMHETIKVREL